MPTQKLGFCSLALLLTTGCVTYGPPTNEDGKPSSIDSEYQKWYDNAYGEKSDPNVRKKNTEKMSRIKNCQDSSIGPFGKNWYIVIPDDCEGFRDKYRHVISFQVFCGKYHEPAAGEEVSWKSTFSSGTLKTDSRGKIFLVLISRNEYENFDFQIKGEKIQVSSAEVPTTVRLKSPCSP